jgi:predicted DNA-binding protein
MSVEISPDLERRLREEAGRRSRSVAELVEEALSRYLEAPGDEPMAVVRAARPALSRVWAVEDFSDWRPPDAC